MRDVVRAEHDVQARRAGDDKEQHRQQQTLRARVHVAPLLAVRGSDFLLVVDA
jgi:hypothetical protein